VARVTLPQAPDRDATLPGGITSPELGALRRHFAHALEAIQADAADLQSARLGWHPLYVDRIRSTAAALHAAIAALGEIDALRSEEPALRLGPVELGDLLMSMLARWKPLAPAHAFELALPGELPAITADAGLVERALDILLASAVALSPAGGTVHVHIRPHADEILVSIQHCGRTLSSRELADVFAPFFCLPDLPFGLADGGLGPALAAAILAAHGGRLWVEPTANGPGCSFHVAWPLVPVVLSRPPDADAPASRLVVAEAEARLAPNRQRQVALVADRDYRMLRYLRANLDARQYRTVVAGDLDEALKLVDLEEPDVIVLAAEAAEDGSKDALRLLKARTQAPVIVLARRYDADECVQLLDLGAADYLVKPFHLDELCARLRVTLRPQAMAASAQAPEPVFRSGELTIDFGQRAVTVGERSVALSRTEFKLLRELARHAGMVMTHEQLLERVWGPAYTREIEFVWVYIRRLRRKIEPEPRVPRYILTVPGVGYRLVRI
jgi:DNA-binding response OmpR family regulator